MKKETVIAIFFGIAFGAVVSLIILAKNKELQQLRTKTIAPAIKQPISAKSSNQNLQALDISEPQDGFVYTSQTIKIKGKAAKDSLIIIQSPIKELAIKNEKERFEVNFPLSLGENVIKIVAYSKSNDNRSLGKELKIYYLEKEL